MGSVDTDDRNVVSVEPDVELAEVGLIGPHGPEGMRWLQQFEKVLRRGWQGEIRTRPRATRIKAKEIPRVEPVEVPQSEVALPDAVLFGPLRETLQELLDFRGVELPNRPERSLEPKIELPNGDSRGRCEL
jgi:hypothetical protein